MLNARLTRRGVWAAVLIVVAIGIVAVWATWPSAGPIVYEIHSPPMAVPSALSATDPRVGADDPVIGVSVGGTHRAYSVGAFADINTHVVNDLLAGQPVSVTHCPRTGCTRVFTDTGGKRLRLSVGGWFGRDGAEELLLWTRGALYHQRTGDGIRVGDGRSFPYQTLEYELTTWGKWQAAHPDSDVYVGGAVPLH